jgi:hypothetical protein
VIPPDERKGGRVETVIAGRQLHAREDIGAVRRCATIAPRRDAGVTGIAASRRQGAPGMRRTCPG